MVASASGAPLRRTGSPAGSVRTRAVRSGTGGGEKDPRRRTIAEPSPATVKTPPTTHGTRDRLEGEAFAFFFDGAAGRCATAPGRKVAAAGASPGRRKPAATAGPLENPA